MVAAGPVASHPRVTVTVPVSGPVSGRAQVTSPALGPVPAETVPGRVPAMGEPPLKRPAMAVAVLPRWAAVKPLSQLPESMALRVSAWALKSPIVS